MLTRLAPQEPTIHPMVQVFLRLSTVLECLLPFVLVHGVENCDWSEADGAGGKFVIAAKCVLKGYIVVVTIITLYILQLVAEHFDVNLDG